MCSAVARGATGWTAPAPPAENLRSSLPRPGRLNQSGPLTLHIIQTSQPLAGFFFRSFNSACTGHNSDSTFPSSVAVSKYKISKRHWSLFSSSVISWLYSHAQSTRGREPWIEDSNSMTLHWLISSSFNATMRLCSYSLSS